MNTLEVVNSRLFNCDLLLAILKEEPKPVGFRLYIYFNFLRKIHLLYTKDNY